MKLKFKRRSFSVENIPQIALVNQNLLKTKSLSLESKQSFRTFLRQKTFENDESNNEFIRPKRPSRKYGTLVRNKASTLAKSFSFKVNKKHLIEKLDTNPPPKQTRKFSLRKKNSKDKDELYMEYRQKSLQILENTVEKSTDIWVHTVQNKVPAFKKLNDM